MAGKMKNIILVAALALATGCAGTPSSKTLEDNEQAVLSRHIEKSAVTRGSFCDGQGFRWYHEGKNYIQFTCKDGSVFSLRKE